MGSHQPIRRIAVIGAGPCGLAAVKYLLAEKCFEQIDVFEQRDRVGGIWNLSSNYNSTRIPLPQTNPRYGNAETNEGLSGHSDENPNLPSERSLELESPLYDYLETNIPKELMTYSDKPLPDDAPLFIGHEATLQYLEEYAEPIKHLISLHTRVLNVKEHDTATDLGRRWEVSTEDLHSGNKHTSIYDAIIVANGHYTIPFVPEVPGLKQWNTDYPGITIHSKAYRRPENYKGQKVLIIGNSVSGLDIAFQIGPYSQKVLLSSRSGSPMGGAPSSSWLEEVPALAEFLPSTLHDRAVKFKNGRVEESIDSVIFATGYFYNYPFLQDLDPPLVTHGFRTEHLYKHLIHISNPTLAFMVLNLKVIPFPLAENQAAVVSRIWSGRLSLPCKSDMVRWEEDVIASRGSGKDFHLLKFPQDAETLNELYTWAESARRVPGLENDGLGKLGTFWDERLVWTRSKFPQIKAAYARMGERRFTIRTVEELGFDFYSGSQSRNDIEHKDRSRIAELA